MAIISIGFGMLIRCIKIVTFHFFKKLYLYYIKYKLAATLKHHCCHSNQGNTIFWDGFCFSKNCLYKTSSLILLRNKHCEKFCNLKLLFSTFKNPVSSQPRVRGWYRATLTGFMGLHHWLALVEIILQQI